MRAAVRGLTIGLAGALAAAAMAAPAGAATPGPTDPSAVGDELVPSISVSPDYATSGFAIALGYGSGSCGQDCLHLWTTHDRGASWHRVAASGWQHGMPTIAMGPGGHAAVLAGGSTPQRSDDGGATWHPIAQGMGSPDAGPPFAADGTLVVAGQGSKDLLVHADGSTTDVAGSGGAFKDMQFAYAPGFPSSGRFAPVLLSAVDSNAGTSAVLQCTAAYTCSAPTVLPSTQKTAGPATLVLSPAYATDGTVFAAEPTALLRSTDGGHSFVPLSLGEPGAAATAVGALALDPHYPQNHTAYAAVLQVFTGQAAVRGGVYATTDNGATWARVGSPGLLDHGATSVAVAPDGRLFAGYIDQAAGGAKGLLCFDGSAWRASCGSAQAATTIPRGHPGPPLATPCSSGCATAAVRGAGGATSAGGASPAGGSSGGGGAPNRPVAAPVPKGSSQSPVIPIALALLLVLGLGSVTARLVERRRRPREQTPPD